MNQCGKPMVVISITHVHPLQIVDKYDWEMPTSTEAASPVASSRAGATTRRIHLNSSDRNSHHPVILQAKETLDLRTSWLECLNHSRLGYEGIDMFWWPNKMNKMNKEPKPFQTRAFTVALLSKIKSQGHTFLKNRCCWMIAEYSWTCLLYDIIFISHFIPTYFPINIPLISQLNRYGPAPTERHGHLSGQRLRTERRWCMAVRVWYPGQTPAHCLGVARPDERHWYLWFRWGQECCVGMMVNDGQWIKGIIQESPFRLSEYYWIIKIHPKCWVCFAGFPASGVLTYFKYVLPSGKLA